MTGLPAQRSERRDKIVHNVIVVTGVERDAIFRAGFDDPANHIERAIAIERRDLDRDVLAVRRCRVAVDHSAERIRPNLGNDRKRLLDRIDEACVGTRQRLENVADPSCLRRTGDRREIGHAALCTLRLAAGRQLALQRRAVDEILAAELAAQLDQPPTGLQRLRRDRIVFRRDRQPRGRGEQPMKATYLDAFAFRDRANFANLVGDNSPGTSLSVNGAISRPS